jgi:carboxyl-terminal processing protease
LTEPDATVFQLLIPQEISVKKNDLSWLWVVLIVTIAALSGGLLGSGIQASPKTSSDLRELLKTYAEVLSLAEENYADEVDTEKTLFDSIRAMLQTLDPHSSFFDSKTYRMFRDDQRGNFYGLGISVGNVNGQPTIMSTLPGTPAHRLGLRSGDIIVKIDGKPSIALSRHQVVERLRGPRRTTVHVSVQREGLSNLLEFSVVRDVIPQPSVPLAFHIRPKVAYVRIENFTETTEQEVENALQSLGSDLEGVLLDLRRNPGGSLQSAIGVADKFLRRGQEVLVTKGRLANANQSYVAPKGAAGSSYAMVVLIDSDSASASEIVAGAIQDHDRGLIAGETSFGKGLVQSVFDLSRGAGVALTTAKWYTPSGRLIQRDYNQKSFFDYFNGKGKETKSLEVKQTDTGRAVYGGGGITPDVVLQPQLVNSFQALVLTNATCFNFVRSYNVTHPHKPSFDVSGALLQEFKTYLDSKQLPYLEKDFGDNLDFIKRQLRYEYLLSQSGIEEAQRVALEGDSQVMKALELLPQARTLFANAAKLVAGKRKPDQSE